MRKAVVDSYPQAEVATGPTGNQFAANFNFSEEVAEFGVVEEPSLLAQFKKTLANPETVAETLQKEEASSQEGVAT